MKHTFVICAYKESPYLEECIQSLLKQTVKTEIIISTSTPNQHIKNLSEKYKIPLYINKDTSNIASDWNYGYSMVQTPYLTIAHQDDIYLPKYVENVIKSFENSPKPLLFFTNYGELRDKKIVKYNQLLCIKRIMLLPLCLKKLHSNIFVRRRILSLGSPICCPSVAYAKNNLPNIIFSVGFRSNEDWEAWEKISKIQGDFIYNKEILMLHRIHEDSETTAIIKDNKRSEEDMILYCKFWPTFIAKVLVKIYAKGQKSNSLK